jgi:2-polyprenyl-3-methyl-5-hydroxy-6-metoxy-1,4-benzoquinol methylase
MSNYYKNVNQKLLQALPAARRVLEIGCAEGPLGWSYKQKYPDAEWVGVDIHARSVEAAQQVLDQAHCLNIERDDLAALGTGFDLVVMGDVLEHLVNPLAVLERIREICDPGAQLVCCIPNMGHFSVVERLLGGDLSYDKDGLLDETHVRFFTLSSAMKLLLDGGWSPHLADFYEVLGKDEVRVQRLMDLSDSLGVSAETAAINLFGYQFIFSCTLREAVVPDERAEISVIVPVDDPKIVLLNAMRSPGLVELGCEVIPIRRPGTAAELLAIGANQAKGDWLFLASPDLYLPKGAGHALSAELNAIPLAERDQALFGFSGVGLNGAGQAHSAGLLFQPQARQDGPASMAALSMEDSGVIVSRQSRHQIDPHMGWSHWATDMCLRAIADSRLNPGRILRVPVFHNITRKSTRTQDQEDLSIQRLLERYAHSEALGVLRRMLAQAA